MRATIVFAALMGCAAAMPAFADSTSTVYYSNQNWEVRTVTWSDQTQACTAEVVYDTSTSEKTFSVWKDKHNPTRLQFYSNDWSFGDKDTFADVGVPIDSNQAWSMHNADFYKNSVLFDLPASDASTQFLQDVSSGQMLNLNDEHGKLVESYSLNGAQPALAKLDECRSALN
ncbi:MAG: hypothetical protein KGJ28_15685 [Alphaproteobacteria bacterium]|nr:hypothetical protein [Alphaproteobacteria bacterium]